MLPQLPMSRVSKGVRIGRRVLSAAWFEVILSGTIVDSRAVNGARRVRPLRPLRPRAPFAPDDGFEAMMLVRFEELTLNREVEFLVAL